MAGQELGSLAILVNNAALGGRPSRPQDGDIKDWDPVLELNLKGTMSACKAAYPALCAAGGGKIINISSAGTRTSFESGTAYGASKVGVEYLTRTLATCWGADNIQVNAILPGPVQTEMATMNATVEARVRAHTPVGRLATPDSFAGIAGVPYLAGF
jgi:2-deoxy-D-gluconate 3-dehydrogenase